MTIPTIMITDITAIRINKIMAPIDADDEFVVGCDIVKQKFSGAASDWSNKISTDLSR